MQNEHDLNCQVCREGLKPSKGETIFGLGSGKSYFHVIAKDLNEIKERLGLTFNFSDVIRLSKKRIRSLVKENQNKREEVIQMKTDLDSSLDELKRLAAIGQAVVDLVKESGSLKPARKKRTRRTKAEMEAAKAAEQPKAPEKPKRKHTRKASATAPVDETKAAEKPKRNHTRKAPATPATEETKAA